MPGDKVSNSSLGHKSLVKFKGFVKQTSILCILKKQISDIIKCLALNNCTEESSTGWATQ